MPDYSFIQSCRRTNTLRIMDAIEFVKLMQEVFAVPFWIDDKGQRAT